MVPPFLPEVLAEPLELLELLPHAASANAAATAKTAIRADLDSVLIKKVLLLRGCLVPLGRRHIHVIAQLVETMSALDADRGGAGRHERPTVERQPVPTRFAPGETYHSAPLRDGQHPSAAKRGRKVRVVLGVAAWLGD